MNSGSERPSIAIRVLLADDHTLVRAGIRALLADMSEVEVVGEAADGEAALQWALRLQPDIVLMDIAMKGMNGLQAAARLRQELPSARVIMLSMHATGDYVQQALRAGAAGYLLKDAATLELQLALQAVARGDIYLSPGVSAQIVEGFLQHDKPAGDAALTPRQSQVLGLIAAGLSTKEIAFKLQLSGKTVDTHRAQLMERLDIRDVAGLVRYAIRIGLIDAQS
ncbi:response regulator [Rhodoferax sp.]|uniref:response regulator n=1 Tax=Rhodoferax sp. TaxID=50421 RepID=UPI0027599C65|nr:response regulator transcription factor [Rhodoferax sp.]